MYRRLLKYLSPYRVLFVASLLAMALGSLLDGFTMVLLIPFLRSLFGEATAIPGGGAMIDQLLRVTVGPFISQSSPSAALRNVVILVMAGLLLKNAFFYTAEALGVKVREGIVRDMRNQLYSHLQRLPLGYFDRQKAGQLLARVFNDTNQTKDIITYTVADVLKHVVSLFAFVTMLVLISWKLTLIVLVAAPLFLGFIKPLLGRVILIAAVKTKHQLLLLTARQYLTGRNAHIRLPQQPLHQCLVITHPTLYGFTLKQGTAVFHNK